MEQDCLNPPEFFFPGTWPENMFFLIFRLPWAALA